MNGDLWFINATDYGHTDWLDKTISDISEMACASGKDIDKPLYEKFIAGEIVAFFKTLLGDDCSLIEYVENPDLMPVQVRVMRQGSGDPCGNMHCKWWHPEERGKIDE